MNTTETVLLWNVRGEQPPHDLAAVIAALSAAMDSVPAEYRQSAHIDFDPYWEHGEHYSQVCVTYSRPMTEAEADQYAAEESAHWVDQLRQAEERATYCRAQIGGLL